ncbi:MAG: DUF4386 domain-containing protein [Cytophagales bacterium]|nr:MAG: DUF4386 domain-containing protein [Cytophagales bacterium]
MTSQRKSSITFGILFILAFAVYILGNGLIEPILGANDANIAIQNNKTEIIIGVILISFLHTIINLSVGSIMHALLNNYHKIVSKIYFSSIILSTILHAFGGIFLLLFIPLSDAFENTNETHVFYFQTLILILHKANFYCYQLGMAIWGFGGLALIYLLLISKLFPKLILWGFVGYIVFIVGTIFELFGFQYGLFLSIPGGLFELFLGFWMIFKGIENDFNTIN